MGKKSGSVSRRNNPDHISEIRNHFSGSGMEKIQIRDPGWKKIQIRDKHPGSATLSLS
jgi:hypothetical protein